MIGKFCKYHFSSANPLSFAYIFLLKAKNEENFVNLLPALQTTDYRLQTTDYWHSKSKITFSV